VSSVAARPSSAVKRHGWLLVIVSFVAIASVTAFLLHQALVRLTVDKNAVPALATAITLVGALLTAAVTLTGLLLRQSIDLRTAHLAEQEHKRLNLQAAMDTVRVLATADGKPSPPEQVSAALVVLARLGELGLAIDLLRDLFPREHVRASTAVTLCDMAFQGDDPGLQEDAALIIYHNWSLLDEGAGQVQWPASLNGIWPPHLAPKARELCTRALEAWIRERPPSEPTDFRVLLVAEAERLGRRKLTG
jgi:hypothetical protein